MKKGLVIITGECYRTFHPLQKFRSRGSKDSIVQQSIAAQTHVDFIKFIEKKFDFKIDVACTTYSTEFNNDIKSLYKECNVLFFDFLPELIGYTNLYKTAVNKVLDKVGEYDFVLFIRIDLILKSFFKQIFNPYSDKITFPFVLYKKHDAYKISYKNSDKNRDDEYNSRPQVCDIIYYIPNKHINLIDKYVLSHKICAQLLDEVSIDNIDCYVHTLHNSNTLDDWNPIYIIANRPICIEWYSNGYVYNFTKRDIDYKEEYKNFYNKVPDLILDKHFR